MKACPREVEVLEAVESSEWSKELRHHSEECGVCKDLTAVALAFSKDYADVASEVRVPPVEFVWWRAELKARQDAANKATQPITLIHGLAAACALAVVFAVGGGLILPGSELARNWLGGLSETLVSYAAGIENGSALAVAGSPLGIVLLLVASGCLMAAPLAAYFIFSDD